MSKAELCLQDLTGSCAGCNIIEIARNKIEKHGQRDNKEMSRLIAMDASKRWCPEGTALQREHLKPAKKSIW